MTHGDWAVHRGGMWLSRRRTFRAGDPGWDEYIAFVGLPQLREVRTLDGALNEDLDGSVYVNALDELTALLDHFEPSAPGTEYYQFLVHQTLERPVLQDPSRFHLLGYDLSDETHTSSLLNCGPWTGELAPFTRRLNPYGLLAQEDARMAQALLPAAWGNDPHSMVEIWALFEINAS